MKIIQAAIAALAAFIITIFLILVAIVKLGG